MTWQERRQPVRGRRTDDTPGLDPVSLHLLNTTLTYVTNTHMRLTDAYVDAGFAPEVYLQLIPYLESQQTLVNLQALKDRMRRR